MKKSLSSERRMCGSAGDGFFVHAQSTDKVITWLKCSHQKIASRRRNLGLKWSLILWIAGQLGPAGCWLSTWIFLVAYRVRKKQDTSNLESRRAAEEI